MILTRRRTMGKKGKYVSQVEYIDISGKYIETEINAADVYAFDFRFTWEYLKGAYFANGGNFAVGHAGGGISEGFVSSQGTRRNTSTNATNRFDPNILRIRCTDDMASVVFYGGNTRTVAYTAPVSTTSGMVNFFKTNTVGKKIYSIKMYGQNGNLIFDGIPVRTRSQGALYDIINDKLYTWTGIGSYGYGPYI